MMLEEPLGALGGMSWNNRRGAYILIHVSTCGKDCHEHWAYSIAGERVLTTWLKINLWSYIVEPKTTAPPVLADIY